MDMKLKLKTADFKLADQEIRRYVARVPEGTTLDDVIHPEFFGNVMHQLMPNQTMVRVLSYDAQLRADIFLVAKTQTTAKWVVDHIYSEPGKEEVKETDMSKATEYVVNFAPAHKWRIIHNGIVIEKGIESKDIANARVKMLKEI